MDQALMNSPTWTPPGENQTTSDQDCQENDKSSIAAALIDEEQAAASRRSRKGKRNKPTLNCKECVDRKTKCDRSRPTCLSCLRRQTSCAYTKVADILAATGGSRPRKRSSHIEFNRPAVPLAQSTATSNVSFSLASLSAARTTQNNQPSLFGQSSSQIVTRLPAADSPSIQRERFTLFPLYETKQHPFGNYWTFQGGLVELVGVLPSKQQADILVGLYFDCVDPLYPIVNRTEFFAEYERFWSMPLEEQCESDPAHLALCFIIYAIGTQHLGPTPHERSDSAEFYVSACHQCLCLFSYLNRASLKTVQTMILLCYFLLSNNHISDAWTFSGMLHRQAYGLGLNLDPEVHHPEASFAEKQQRCSLWYAIIFQDTSLSLYCELPPSTVYNDIDFSALRSASSSPQDYLDPPTDPLLSIFSDFPALNQRDRDEHDIDFMTAMWRYASFCQEHLCIPRALRRAVCTDAVHKAKMIAEFRNMYATWPSPFNSTNPSRFDGWDTRLIRQTIATASVYFWVLMTMSMDSNETSGVESDFDGALEAAHEGLTAFFALVRIEPSQADSWSVHHTRAYDQAAMIGNILATQNLNRDAGRMLAKSDLERYIDILLRSRGCAEFETLRKKRLADLEALRLSIKYV